MKPNGSALAGRLRRRQNARKEQELHDRAVELLRNVVAAGGRLELGADTNSDAVWQVQKALTTSGQLPYGQRLAQEPTRMDPIFGITVYLEPDFEVVTPLRSVGIPRQLRDPHPAVVEFQNEKALVSKVQIGRAARFIASLCAGGE